MLCLQEQLHLLRRRHRGQLPARRHRRRHLPLPHRHRALLHPQGETVCQV